MYFSHLFSILPTLFLLVVFVSAADTTYWIDQTCLDKENFENAFKEVVWSSRRIKDELIRRNEVLNDPLQWFFNFNVMQMDVEKVITTFDRFGKMIFEPNRDKAWLRVYCDNDDRYKPIDGILEPDDAMQRAQLTYFFDGDQSYVKGNVLSCKLNGIATGPNSILRASAHTIADIEGKSVSVKGEDWKSNQPAERASITFCKAQFEGDEARHKDLKKNALHPNYNTIKDLRKLGSPKDGPFDGLEKYDMDLGSLNDNLFKIIAHELTHVPTLSTHIVDKMTGMGIPIRERIPYGVDFHPQPGGTSIVGYYQNNRPDRKTLPGPRLGRAEYTVMNPDSYANVLTIFRFRDKQYEAYVDPAKDADKIFLRYKRDWQEGPDWDSPGQKAKRVPSNI